MGLYYHLVVDRASFHGVLKFSSGLNPYRLLNSKQGASPRLESGKVATLGLAPSSRGKIRLGREYQRGKHHCTIDFLFDWFGISCLTTDNFGFYLQNRLIQTSQTGGQWYRYTSPFSIPWTRVEVTDSDKATCLINLLTLLMS